MAKDEAPGLTYRVRKGAPAVPYWIASKEAVRAGYPIRTRNLSSVAQHEIISTCHSLQISMMQWLAKHGEREPVFDGTIRSVIDLYKTHPESPLHAKAQSTRGVYDVYLPRLRTDIGDRRVDNINGIDLLRWHRDWSSGGKRLGAGAMYVAVLKAALSFGVAMRLKGCADLKVALAETTIQKPAPRNVAPTAKQVDALRDAAHRLGHPSIALAAAFQFEGAIRLWDMIGKWLTLDDPTPSTYLHGGMKWVGMRWEMIDAAMILRFTPAKTAFKTGKTVAIDLKTCPMVVEEIARVPDEQRRGPIIVSARTGQPWRTQDYRNAFRRIHRAAGWPDGMWSRDMRAGAFTEASMGGASSDDRAKLGAHSKRMQAQVYDRDTLEAARRVKTAGLAHRAKDEA